MQKQGIFELFWLKIGKKEKMCQEMCLKILKEEKRWMSSKEITEKMGVSNSQAICLMKLYKQGEIYRKEVRTRGRNTTPMWRIKE